MKEKIKIGNLEASCLLLNMLSCKIILDFPRITAEEAGTAAWLMTLLVSIVAFCLFLILSRLYKKFEGQDILDLGENAFGTAGRILTGIIFLVQFLLTVPFILRQFAEDIKVISLTSTPVSAVIFLFCAGMMVGSWLGLETLARIHVLIIPILAVTFLFILGVNAPRFDISKLAPWLGPGADVILKKSVANLSIYSELIVLFFISPYLNNKSDFGSIGRYGLFFSGFFLVLSSLCYLLVYQYPTATEFFLPIYQMARAIRIGRFFSRIEPSFILIWASSAFLYLSSGMFFITYLFQNAFGLKYRKPLILPFTILVFTLSIIPENLYSILQVQIRVYRKYFWTTAFLLPLLLLSTASIRARRKKEKEAEAE